MRYAIRANGTVVASTNDRSEARQLAAAWSLRSCNRIATVYCREGKWTITTARNGRIESDVRPVVRRSCGML